MKTPATEEFPGIEWELTTQELSRESVHDYTLLATGKDFAGNEYSANATMCDEEVVVINEIELEISVKNEPTSYWNGYEYIENK